MDNPSSPTNNWITLFDPPVEIHGALDKEGNVKRFDLNEATYLPSRLIAKWDDPGSDHQRTYHAYTLHGMIGCLLHHDRSTNKWYAWCIATHAPQERSNPHMAQ